MEEIALNPQKKNNIFVAELSFYIIMNLLNHVVDFIRTGTGMLDYRVRISHGKTKGTGHLLYFKIFLILFIACMHAVGICADGKDGKDEIIISLVLCACCFPGRIC